MKPLVQILASIASPVVFVLSASVGMATDANAACVQWDVSGDLRILQGDSNVVFSIKQDGNLLKGFARVSGSSATGELDGVLNGSKLELTVFWSSKSIGFYQGEIGPTGRVEGKTFDKKNSKVRASWFSKSRVECEADQATNTPPAKDKKPADPIVSEVESGTVTEVLKNSHTCKSGFVWRVARPEDLVCVTPEVRARTEEENTKADERRDPQGAYGSNSCIAGFVWREAFDGDIVCVTPRIRALVRKENSLGPSRRVGG